jgi:hypothetical protein
MEDGNNPDHDSQDDSSEPIDDPFVGFNWPSDLGANIFGGMEGDFWAGEPVVDMTADFQIVPQFT